jgi:hypothetical protein
LLTCVCSQTYMDTPYNLATVDFIQGDSQRMLVKASVWTRLFVAEYLKSRAAFLLDDDTLTKQVRVNVFKRSVCSCLLTVIDLRANACSKVEIKSLCVTHNESTRARERHAPVSFKVWMHSNECIHWNIKRDSSSKTFAVMGGP